MEHSGGQPAEVDITRPSAARVYDYFLGGAHNFEVDRQLAEQIAGLTPNLAETMRANRSFLRRAVRFLVDQGICRSWGATGTLPPVIKDPRDGAPQPGLEGTTYVGESAIVTIAPRRSRLPYQRSITDAAHSGDLSSWHVVHAFGSPKRAVSSGTGGWNV